MGDHTESVDLQFDPSIITYNELLNLFWKNHTCTRKTSTQYMSAIHCHNENQLQLAEKSFKEEQDNKAQPVVTKVGFAGKFHNAEDYHQKYMLRQHYNLFKSLGLSDKALVSSHTAARLNGFVAGYGGLAAFEKEREKLGLNCDQVGYVRKQLSGRRP